MATTDKIAPRAALAKMEAEETAAAKKTKAK